MTVKFPIDGKELHLALKAVGPAINARNCIPILGCVLFSGSSEGLRVEGTDLDSTIAYTIPGDYPEFAVAVEYFRLRDFVRMMSWSHLTIEAGEESFRLVDFLFASEGGAPFPARHAGDWPDIRQSLQERTHQITFDPKLVHGVAPAMSTEETRYYLNGMFFERDEADQLRLVATDGHRLRLLETEVGHFGPSVIVPHRIVCWLATQREPGALLFGENCIEWNSGRCTMLAKCIEGTFPNYRRVIPSANLKRVTINRKELMSVIQLASIYAPGKAKAISLQFKDDKAIIGGRGEDGEVKLQIDAIGGQDLDFKVGFNSRFVTESLASLKGDTVDLLMIDNCSPTIIKEDKLTQLLMPLRV